MTFARRPILQALALAALAATAATSTFAQGAGNYPNRPIKLIVPFAAGGSTDVVARVLAEGLRNTLGQPVVVDNKPGAGGVVAGRAVAGAAPDGSTLLLISSGTAVSQALFKTLPYDTLAAFAPVAPLATFDLVIVARQGGAFATLQDLVAFARSHPGEVNLGTPNIGTTQHLAAEWFKGAAGLKLQVVPFRSTPEVVNAIRGGQIHAGLDILSPLLPQIEGGALRALAITGARRSRILPQVPTAQEAGVKDLDAASWNGLAAPAGTPQPVIARLNQAVNAALADAQVRERLQALNLDPHPGTPQQAGAMLAGDIARWNRVIDAAGIARQ